MLPQNPTGQTGVHVDGTNFSLHGKNVSYRFYVDGNGDILSTHFGGRIDGVLPYDPIPIVTGWSGMLDRVRREVPDQGRGDFRSPAIQICYANTHSILAPKYQSHEVVKGKPALPGLPATFGSEKDVTTLVVHLYDDHCNVVVDMLYSVFPNFDAIVRSVSITNKGTETITVEELASFSVDMPYDDYDMISLRGDWARETQRQRRRVDYGIQGFKSSTGFSSHFYNPFFALVSTSTTESQGESWGFSLVYSGSYAVTVEKGGQGFTRAQMGLNSNQLSWPLRPNETLTSPECVSVYSKDGIGGMSRSLHSLYRNHLMKSQFATSIRPVLLNSWEALYYNLDQSKIFQMALESAALGVKLFVLDDGWFGDKHPRLSDTAGLGDWVPNPMRFPNGLGPMVKDITALKPQNSSTNMRFGLWIEPEMVNPKSSLCEEHPQWILHAGQYPRTEQRNQLILNLALAEVQDHIINSISDVLLSADITYIKWDHNRCIHEAPSSSSHHAYMLGVYRVFEELTSRFPNILWEGCASGGGRCDPGVLQYFPQVWTSDNTDALERIFIQFGASIVYPAGAMSGHISAVPNHQTGRTIPLTFRAHVAMMCGSFGFELNPAELLPHEKSALPQIIALSEKINPIVVNGNLWRLSLPEDSNWPAMMFVSQDGSQAVLFYFQIRSLVNHAFPRLKLQGLHAHSTYFVDGEGPFSGQTLMNLGLQYSFESDYGSRVILLEQQHTS